MSREQAKGAQPRLVTKAPSRPGAGDRWAHDETLPHPAAQADALGATVLAYLITGPVLFGGLGWLVDQWLDTSFVVAVGAVLGMALSLYTIWLRYGNPLEPLTGGESPLRPGARPHNEENQ